MDQTARSRLPQSALQMSPEGSPEELEMQPEMQGSRAGYPLTARASPWALLSNSFWQGACDRRIVRGSSYPHGRSGRRARNRGHTSAESRQLATRPDDDD